MQYGELFQTSTGNLILEAPQSIGPTEFNLDDRAINRAFAAKQMRRVTEVIEDTPDYQLARTGDGRHGWILLYNKHDKTADYVVQYETRNWNLLPPTVTQCVLWRDAGSAFVRGITVRVFFDYLLQHHPAIMSDRLQTQDGNRFWITRMVDAIARNFRVGVVDLPRRKINWFDPSAGIPFRDWLDDQKTYGPAALLQGVRYLIAR